MNEEAEKSELEKAMSVVKDAGYTIIQTPMTNGSITLCALKALSIFEETLGKMGGSIYPDMTISPTRWMAEDKTEWWGPCVSLKVAFDPRALTEYMRQLHPQDERNEQA